MQSRSSAFARFRRIARARLPLLACCAALIATACSRRETPVQEAPVPRRVQVRLVETARIQMPTARQVAFLGTRAFVAQNFEGMTELDASDPAKPRVQHRLAPSQAQPLHIRPVPPDMLAVADRFRGLVMWRVADTDAPTTLAELAMPGIATHLDVLERGGRRFAVVACGGEGVTIVDISDPAAPKIVGRHKLDADYSRRIAVDGDIAYVADNTDGGLKVLDIARPDDPQLLLKVLMPGFCQSVERRGELLLSAYRTHGVRVFRVEPRPPAADRASTPGLTLLSSVHRTRNRVQETLPLWDDNATAPQRRLAAFADDAAGIELYDFADPAAPLLVGEQRTPDSTLGLAFHRGFLYAACWNAGVVVYDLR